MRVSSGALARLDDVECWQFVERHSLGRIGYVDAGAPMILPVNYGVDRGRIVVRTALGTALAATVSGSPAAFEVDEASELFESGTSVVIRGILRPVDDAVETDRLRQLRLRSWAPGERDHFIVLEPTTISGRRIASHEPGDGLSADGG